MTTSPTEQIVADMLVENTGRHMLDSGGAYGRSWERNQGQTVESFKARSAATIDRYGCVTLDVFHWLTDRVIYVPDEDAAFHEWAQTGEHADEPWLESARIWAEDHNVGDLNTVNTYNGEDFLSQTLQWVEWEQDTKWGSERRLLIQIHGGCDVRGGYTAPRMFKLDDYSEGLWDNADATVYCAGTSVDPETMGQVSIDGRTVTSEPLVQHSFDLRGGSLESVRTDTRDVFGDYSQEEEYGTDVKLYDVETDDDGAPLCPLCGAVLAAEAPYPC